MYKHLSSQDNKHGINFDLKQCIFFRNITITGLTLLAEIKVNPDGRADSGTWAIAQLVDRVLNERTVETTIMVSMFI